MNFFKRLFSSKKEDAPKDDAPELKGIFREDAFAARYTEQALDRDSALVDGSLKMIESYFLENKIEKGIKDPVNHPANLDQTIDEGVGFHLYCQAFKLEDGQTVAFLAYGFIEYLVSNYGFKLYIDNQPEQPMRSMTLKYDKNGVVLSIYPYEYALKVLNFEATFSDLYEKIKKQLTNLPNVDDMINKMTGPED